MNLQTNALNLGCVNQLIQELSSGTLRRHTYTRWEMDLLLDLAAACADGIPRVDLLRRYQKSVQTSFAFGQGTPPRLATFVEQERERRALRRRASRQ